MWRLIQSECIKIGKSDYYRRLFVIYLLISLATLSQERGTKSAFFMTGYEWFCVRQLMGGWAWMPIPFFIAEYIAGDFRNHGYTSTLLCGFTRKEILCAKGIVCAAGVLVLALTNTVVGLAVTILLNGFGAELNKRTITHMTVRFIYYLVDHIADTGVFAFVVAVIVKSKAGTMVLSLVILELMGSTTGRIWYILKDIKNPIWKEIVHKMFEFTPLYQIDSLLVPEHFRPHQFWQYLLSCSVWLVVTYLITLYFFKRSDLQ